jgi:serine/threonine protein kinase
MSVMTIDPISTASGPKEALKQPLFSGGQILCEKYQVLAFLGQGGMGSVYHVRQMFLKKEFAMKVMESGELNETALQRFQMEAAAASALNHPSLVQVHDFGLVQGYRPYLVMDYVNGLTFAEYLAKNGPLKVEEVPAFFVPVCFGLLAAHDRGVVHRDIKPGNIMVANSAALGTDGSVKIVDFGIAKLMMHESGEIQALTKTGEIFGSPLYMSPEQCLGSKVDHRSDIYSLGCVLFEMLAGTPPHMGQNALSTMLLHKSEKAPTLKEASLGKNFPDEIERIVAKMLAHYPEERYQNLAVVANDLNAACSGRRSTTARKLTMPASSAKRSARKSFDAKLILVPLVSAVVSGFAGYKFKEFQYLDAEKSTRSQKSSVTEPVPASDVQKDPSGYTPEVADAILGRSSSMVGDMYKEERSLKQQELKRWQSAILPIVIDGRKRFDFPDCGIGELWHYDPRGSENFICKAKGHTPGIEVDWPLELRIDKPSASALVKVPAFFSNIDAAAFVALSLECPQTMGLSNQNSQQNGNAAKAAGGVSRILAIISGWTNLEAVRLSETRITADGFQSLNKISRLQYLYLDNCSLSASLAEQPFLQHLKRLSVTRTKDVDGTLQALAMSKTLDSLILRKLDISAASIGALKGCPRLSSLQIAKNGDYGPDFMRSLAELKTLESLHIEGSVKPDQIRELIENSPSIVQLKLSKKDFTPQQIGEFKALSNKIEIDAN